VGQIDHPDGQGANEVDLPFTVTVTDSDGSTASSTFHISVVDDVPTAVDDVTQTLKEGGESVSGNVMANDIRGADDPVTVTEITYTDESGQQVTASVDPVNGVTVDTQYGSLTIAADGSYTYTSDANETHTNGQPLTEGFTYTITDNDGDSSSAVQAFTIKDTGPTIDPPTPTPPNPPEPPPPGEPPVGEEDPDHPELGINAGRVNENDLADGSDTDKESTTVTGELNIDYGNDGPGGVAFTGEGDLPALTSNGVPITYTNDGGTITGTAGGTTIFTMTLTGGGTGYAFELVGQIDHPDGQGANEVDLPFTVTVTDSDGSTASSTFHISVVDDVPTAVDDVTQTLKEGGESVSGNVMANDIRGADDPVTVTEITYTDESGQQVTASVDPVNGVTVDTQYGSLTIAADGSYTYTSDANETHTNGQPLTEGFTYTITDNDGDSSSAVQAFT
ncbi:MAG: VCBS domain-containing protein, partial [Balneola sp.]|nr:VCBS domain-containing protein [Balneola sp.]